MSSHAVALWCALLLLACAHASVHAYTVDCNHEYTDCESELSKLTAEEEDSPTPKTYSAVTKSLTNKETIDEVSTEPSNSTPKITEKTASNKTQENVQEVTEAIKPKPRLLNLSVNELQNFANALHNQTKSIDRNSKKNLDLSDVNLDDDDEELPRIGLEAKQKIPDKFYSNLQAPFHSILPDRGSEEIETCRENEINYKIGDHIDRGCEETCECMPGGVFDCSPRCKHPYIRRGRQLNDPLCFESPVDDCCSIIACATGNGDAKVPKLEVCRYGNDTHVVGSKWNIGCEQTCVCEPNSVVTCKPRCKPLIPSEKCINVQDPNDICCEVQVCDVSQDVHEEPADNITISTTSRTSEHMKDFEDYEDSPTRPLVLAEPIGSIKVLHNNSVQVNLIHINDTEDPVHLLLSDDSGRTFKDVELKYSNLILNLEGGKNYILKTKETGTKFNFTITASDAGTNEFNDEDSVNNTRVGCYHDGEFYAVGDEFKIGCTELCECTGPDMRECAALVCPSHVGLELMSKGCVRWAPNPPPQPPNCCPRTARCLSDGTCHYKGVAVPNWSEVPISLTGCEQRCFCENGELDCQEVCSPLPPIPPQSLRCPPMHRPAPMNISDEDCCKQWGCLPNNAENHASIPPLYSMPESSENKINYVTPMPSVIAAVTTVLPKPPIPTPFLDLIKKQNFIKSLPKFLKNTNEMYSVLNIPQYTDTSEEYHADNITVFTLHDIDSPFKTILPEPPLVGQRKNYKFTTPVQNREHFLESLNKHSNYQAKLALDNKISTLAHEKTPSVNLFHSLPNKKISNVYNSNIYLLKLGYDPVERNPIVELPKTFLPTPNRYVSLEKHHMNQDPDSYSSQIEIAKKPTLVTKTLFIPQINTKSYNIYNMLSKPHESVINYDPTKIKYTPQSKKVNVLRNKDKNKDAKPVQILTDPRGINTHLLIKERNPYETVLHRVLTSPGTYSLNRKTQSIAGHKYSSLDLERLLSQMEVESEVNRNLERSTDKKKDAAGLIQDYPAHPQHPQSPFLPTIPPDHYPQEDIPDYDQNNIHRPVNSLEPNIPGLPPGLTIPPYAEDNKKLSVLSLVADSSTSVKMLFGLPPVLVGLRGSVDLRYTDKTDEDISRWYSQVFAPADEVLTTPRLEFRLTGLRPSTLYKIRGKLYLHNLPVEPESEIYTIRTQDSPTIPPVEEKRREIDSRLTVVDVNVTSAHVSWRHFTEEELQFIDGIQVRYRPVGTPIYSMTELLHHGRSAAELSDLRPGTKYEASLILIPPPRSVTELHDPGRVEFTTSPYTDPYNWSVVVEARTVGSEAAELTWRGVPSPAEMWVRVYRAAHECGPPGVGTRREHDAFRLAARDQPPSITLTGLDPNTRCRVWLELFLTNGKVKTSNVLEINTKSQDSPEPIDNEIEASSIAGSRGAPRGDYYGALVVVGVVAALGAMTSLLLLLVVVRRHRPRSVSITPVPTAPRESSLPPYDNPAYKLELQQETMDL